MNKGDRDIVILVSIFILISFKYLEFIFKCI